MRKHFLSRTIAAALTLLVCGGAVDWGHLGGDDADCSVVVVPHDHTAHRFAANPSGASTPSDHCYICHSLRLLHVALAAGQERAAAAGVSCAGVAATPEAGITSCAPNAITATRLVVPAAGTGDPLNNPTRVAPRNLFDVGFGLDNVLRTEHQKLKVRFSIINVTNQEALYKFSVLKGGRALRIRARGSGKFRVHPVRRPPPLSESTSR